MDVDLAENVVVRQLWAAYRKTDDYRIRKMEFAIPAHHVLVEKREKDGVREIVTAFRKKLLAEYMVIDELRNRSVSEWMQEWCKMHHLIFRRILKNCGSWRKMNVTFGDPHEDIFRVPSHQFVVKEISELASKMPMFLSKRDGSIDEKCDVIANFHYEFVRIHPFFDGNGRIARAVSDQIAVCLALPPVMADFPRTEPKKKESYHKAIRECALSHTNQSLSMWIREKVEQQQASLIA